MAGFYDDYPAPRLDWHIDGTVLLSFDGAYPPTTLYGTANLSQRTGLNGEPGSVWSGSGSGYRAFIFPRLMDIVGLYIGPDQAHRLEWSANTTNGLDGTWTLVTTDFSEGTHWRQHIRPLSLTGVAGIRVKVDSVVAAMHIFGSPTTLPTGQVAAIWHPTDDEPVDGAHFDFGDNPVGSSSDVTFRVKNLSVTETASSVVVDLRDSTDSSPSFTDAHYLSDDGTAFGPSVTITSLAPGEISDVLTLRRVYGVSQPLGVYAAMVQAEADTWA